MNWRWILLYAFLGGVMGAALFWLMVWLERGGPMR